MKEILAAGVLKIIRFTSDDDLLRYLGLLRCPHAILDACRDDDGSLVILLLVQYDTFPLIDKIFDRS